MMGRGETIVYGLWDRTGIHTYITYSIREDKYRVAKIAPQLYTRPNIINVQCENVGVAELKSRIAYAKEVYNLVDYIVSNLSRWDIFHTLGMNYDSLQSLRYGSASFCTDTSRSVDIARQLTGQLKLKCGDAYVQKTLREGNINKLKNYIG